MSDSTESINWLVTRVTELESDNARHREVIGSYADRAKELEAWAMELSKELTALKTWQQNLAKDHHEKLVHNQTLESASENWDRLDQTSFDFKRLFELLSKADKLGLK